MKIAIKTAIMTVFLAAITAWGQPTCSNATLKGDYGFTITGTRPFPQTASIETIVGTAMTTFDGDGKLTQTDNIHGSLSGFAAPDRAGSGTYSINPDCSGTMSLSSPGSPTLTLRIVVVDNGNEVRTAVVDPVAVMVTSNGRRVVTSPNIQATPGYDLGANKPAKFTHPPLPVQLRHSKKA